MKTFHCLVLIGAACALAGCPRREPTLDEAIDARWTVTNLGPNRHARFTTDGGTFACTVLGAGTLMLFR